ncbi:MAG: hypothetical protein ACRC1K_19595 [Planctomycetia bacterium]
MIALHIVFGPYGSWLPNDPRGSWSTYVGADHLYNAGGRATRLDRIENMAAAPHDRTLRRTVQRRLLCAPVLFTG